MVSETSEAVPRAREDVRAATIAHALRATAAQHPDVVAVRTPDDAVSLTWSQLRDASDALARGLRGLGVGHGDAVAVLLVNRPEFHVADLAVLALGGTPFSVYQTLPPAGIAHQLRDSGARVVLTESAFLDRVIAAAGEVDGVDHVIALDAEARDGVLAWDDVLESEGEEIEPAGSPDDVATLIYTSGTTGPPKGVEITHANLFAAIASLQSVLNLTAGERVISWLPTAHIAERVCGYYLPVLEGLTVTCCPDPAKVAAVLPTVRPHWFFAVPRVWEKIKAALEAQGIADPSALDDDARAALRAKLGLDQARVLAAGGAPSPPHVLEYFGRLGAPVGELWGMSEISGAATLDLPGSIRLGTVGRALPGVELRISGDGELLVRGGTVMRGYRRLPERTAEALDDDGWLATGDLATIDEDGYVRIVGRKKELIINAAGKNMSPGNIEAALKAADPLIGQAVAIGDGRPYNVALIVLDPEHLRLAGDGDLIGRLQAAVEKGNETLARVEQIKRFHVIDGDWLPGGDELTPTSKLKRAAINDKYQAEIDALYAGG